MDGERIGLRGRSLRIVPLQSAKAFGKKNNIQPKRNDTWVVPYKPRP